MAAEVEGLELDLADAELLRRGVLRRLVLHQPLQTIERRGTDQKGGGWEAAEWAGSDRPTGGGSGVDGG